MCHVAAVVAPLLFSFADLIAALDIGGASTASFDECTFATNRGPNDGGAVWMHDAASTSFKDSKFEGNFAAATYVLGQHLLTQPSDAMKRAV